MYDQYNPYGFIPPQFGQPNPPYMQNRANPPAIEVVPVQTIQQVEQVGLQPGQRKMVMVQNDAVVALRVADPVSGLVDTKYYNLVEFDPRAVQSQQPQANFVTAEQLEIRLAALMDSLKPAAKGKGKVEAE